MIEFKKLSLDDFEKLKPFFETNPSKICDNTIGTLFMWRHFFDTEFAIFNETLVLKLKYMDNKPAFMMPLGKEVQNALNEILDYCKENKTSMRMCFVTEKDKNLLLDKFDAEVFEDVSWSDYMYLASDLALMTGKKYNGPRNHINAFKRENEDYKIELLSEDNALEVLQFFENHIDKDEQDAMLKAEQIMVREVLSNLKLYKMNGIVLYVKDGIAGFSAGEIIDDVLYVHIEKANSKIRGAYQMLVKEYATLEHDKVKEINREEDLGDEGLRKSKLSYKPSYLIPKYTVMVK
ncbi:MAG: DUF2156 domain-containing protein [Clostridia bacterium]|nr:DUF2156 domain-containing protein [Clostridia bacterium]